MSRTERREYLVGVAATLVCLVGFTIAVMANRHRSDGDNASFHLAAEFARVDGLHEGSPVRLAGVPVGTVSHMELEDGFRALLTLEFKHPLSLAEDSSAAIQTDGLFGTKFIEIQPGGADKTLRSGERIYYVQDSVIIEDLIAQIVSRAKAAHPTKPQQPAEQPAP
jgi:phospholipid/cholesterol/gamma-HCH transport system substrate-binding protein